MVVGKLCAPPELSAAELLQALDAAAAAQPSIHLYVPELASAAGQHERAAVEQRRIAMIRDSA